jgi:hypothetical protein
MFQRWKLHGDLQTMSADGGHYGFVASHTKKKHVFPGYGWYGVHSFMMYKNESGLLERRWHRDVEVPHHILLWEGAWL